MPFAPSYSSQSIPSTPAPPVPSLPPEHQRNVASPMGDPFSASHRAFLESKPLPPVIGSPRRREADDNDDRSMVFVDKVLPESTSTKQLESSSSIKPAKRRSMSAGETELKKAMLTSSTPTPIVERKDVPAHNLGDTTLNHILVDFQGELSQLDPDHNSNLDLHDPSTPARRATRSKTNEHILDSPSHEVEKSPTAGSPVLSLEIPSHSLDDSPQKSQVSPIVPPRSSSLLQKPRLATRPSSIGVPYNTPPRHASGPLRSRTGPLLGLQPNSRDAGRLRTLHRSTASSSEPSLIPTGDDTHACQFTPGLWLYL